MNSKYSPFTLTENEGTSLVQLSRTMSTGQNITSKKYGEGGGASKECQLTSGSSKHLRKCQLTVFTIIKKGQHYWHILEEIPAYSAVKMWSSDTKCVKLGRSDTVP